MEIQTGYIMTFLLVLLRTSLFFAMMPFWGSKVLPLRFKVGLIVALSVVIAYSVDIDLRLYSLPFLVITEMITGAGIGIITRAVLLATEMAGQLISNMIGMSIATFYDPEVGQSNEVSRFLSIMVIFAFFSLDVHHDLIVIFVKSYELLPMGGVDLQVILKSIVYLAGYVSVLGLKIAAPVVVMMMITNIAMGFISRAVPQMNIFFVGYPVYFFIGFVTLAISVPAYMYLFEVSFGEMKRQLIELLTTAGGGNGRV